MTPDFETAIVGTGFSGLGMAIQLRKACRDSFVLLEKSGELGGTWRDNHYPGCACDIPSHLYSFSFELNPDWSRMYAPQPEILAYLRGCARKYGIDAKVRFHSEVTQARFDERHGLWEVTVNGRETLTARHLVLGIGALSRPAIPRIEGLDRFAGPKFHSAQWKHDVPLEGKRIAVVGTGASAIQFIPQIAPQAQKLLVFQRSAPWVLPKPDRAFRPLERSLFGRLPLLRRLFRAWLYWTLELQGVGFTLNPKVLRLAAWMGRRHLRRQIPDPQLRRRVTPDYLPGCKRILMANDYYPALARPNVEVITEEIRRVTEHAIVTADGAEHPVDAIVFGTGFQVLEPMGPMRIHGRGGREIREQWKERIEAYRGTTLSGFPNLYILMGPNTGLGHNSMVFMIESQIRYVLSCMEQLERQGKLFADVTPQAQEAYNRRLAPRLKRSVWASGCKSWYLDDRGHNSTLWPGFTFEFRLQTRSLSPEDHELVGPSA